VRILHVTHQYAPAIGGSERYVTDLCEELVRRGHAIDVLTSRAIDYQSWANVLPPCEESKGVVIHRFRSLPRTAHTWQVLDFAKRRYPLTRQRRLEPLLWYGNGPHMPGLWWRMLRTAGQYDLVHINHLHYGHSWPAFVIAQQAGVPVVITPHVHAEQWDTYDTGYLRRILREADGVICQSAAETRFMAERGFTHLTLTGGVGQVLENFPPQDVAAARAAFGLQPDAFVMLFLGRKTTYKGLAQCVATQQALWTAGYPVWLLAVGPETDFSRDLWADQRAANAMAGIIVRDTVSDTERLQALAACNVVTLPSIGEAFGIIYLEGWTYRKPVIGMAIDSVASVVTHGSDGFLVDPADPGQMTGYVHRLLAEPDLAHRMGDAGHEKLHRRYTIGALGELVEGFYHRVVRHHRTTAP